ncbi:MAG: ATP-grasp domain-containing protein [Muribaculaceae bacterium]|jgi:carbamoyl-phosphate synthase large subunit|nr:ATP-grasp domain-containing protein [Muribaculaceae bacterium]
MSDRQINILMLGGAKRVSMAEQLIRAGKEAGATVRIFSHELDTEEPIAAVGTVIAGGKYSSPEIDKELDGIIAEHHINIVLPFVDPAVEVASRVKTRNKNVFVPVSDEGMSAAMFDKEIAATIFEKHGLPIPKTYTAENMTFPAILKPRTGSASKGIIVAEKADDIAEVQDFGKYLIQEYIADREEYSVDCYVGMSDGKVKCAVTRLRIATVGGEVVKTRTVSIAKLEEASITTLQKLGLKGAVTLQFIHDLKHDNYVLMEINPRLGGGVICSILAGADIARMIIDESEGRVAKENNDWAEGTLMTRYFKEVMFHNK